ncbi:MAG: hypothetical protein LQ350_004223 [Teloschistes chrysophthalmus]|nr:MAG: hypothetical protein LQ350_004223 [Niorma chrysophthalma]
MPPSLPPPLEASTHGDGASGDSFRSQSPASPPFSPITPVMSNSLPSQEIQENHPDTIPPVPMEVPLLPVSESDNPDAIALRAALSILQMQRQQTLKDLATLEQQKKQALVDPEGFSKAIATGEIRTRSTGVLEFSPEVSQPNNSNELGGSVNEAVAHTNMSNFGFIPGPQNIVRCPPVNWAKYHVVGESLDRLHEEQRRRPVNYQSNSGEPQVRGQEHVVAAPYDPWKDQLRAAPQGSESKQTGSNDHD